MITPYIIDRESGQELWRLPDCAAHCGISEGTWRSYYKKGMTPSPVGQLGPRILLWFAHEVRQWHAGRPGHGGRSAGS